ncbi:uncharacterized protein LOC131650175 [Vicia villosa]|uniref:uncharacterized protein LOC131650175 n=1 Tax=Vicia villosa TaxID=3911 RepID=UPI00273C6EAB|nr:uncharacterized protein LOC131650175 [Vicia villosa]
MSIDSSCPFYSSGIENVQHIFMDCHFAKQVLFASSIGYRTPNYLEANQWIQSVLECGDVHSVQVFCACLYKIWAARNLVVFQGKSVCPIAVAGGAFDCVQDYIRWPPDSDGQKSPSAGRINVTYPHDVHFAQVDAGFTEEGDTVFGCTFKDPFSKVLMAASKKDQIVVDASLAELMAIRWCILLAADLRMDKIVFQSDALVVVDCINSISCNGSLESGV